MVSWREEEVRCTTGAVEVDVDALKVTFTQACVDCPMLVTVAEKQNLEDHQKDIKTSPAFKGKDHYFVISLLKSPERLA